MQKIPNREFQAWKQWQLEEFDRPSRTDYYLMQIAAIVCTIFGGDSKLGTYVLKTGQPKKIFQATDEDRIKQSQSAWKTAFLIKGESKDDRNRD